MEIKNRAQLLEFIKKQSLKLVKENGAFAALEDKVDSVDESFIEVYQKKLDKLESAEEKAMAEENYVELQSIKEQKVVALKRLIDAYKFKTKILEQIHDGLKQELDEIGSKGSGVFRDKAMNEFTNEDVPKGTVLKLTTNSAEIKIEKITDNNQYSILETNATGFQPGDVLAMPPAVKVGHSANVTIYRKINDRFQEIGKTNLQVIKGITKNPS
jgi:hypothetical protein